MRIGRCEVVVHLKTAMLWTMRVLVNLAKYLRISTGHLVCHLVLRPKLSYLIGLNARFPDTSHHVIP